jgi:hypothetical protein
MMLPILISVSLAPGSYFFCADAGAAASAPAVKVAKATTATKRPRRSGIVLSLFDVLLLVECRKALVGLQAPRLMWLRNGIVVGLQL